jgi:NAD(P)-dependent dehydrogenase (short-subunit alcohol dehydrogenase family)
MQKERGEVRIEVKERPTELTLSAAQHRTPHRRVDHAPLAGALQEGHNAGMTASQKHDMKQRPDCGEERYRGSGKLQGKVAVVTGGDSGIGRAVVIAFAREGADIALVYNKHDEDAADTARYVEQAGRRCLVLKKDLSTGPGVAEEVVNATMQAFGKVTTLVLNAGIQFEENSLDGITPENLTKIFETNVYANVWLSKAAVKHFKEHAGCTITFNTSINAFAGNKSLISYSATKGAEQALCRCELGRIAEVGVLAAS